MDNLEVTKIDEATIEVTKTIPVSVETKTYDVNFLTGQRDQIKADAQAYADARAVELKEVEGLLAECDKMGVVATVEEPPVEKPIA